MFIWLLEGVGHRSDVSIWSWTYDESRYATYTLATHVFLPRLDHVPKPDVSVLKLITK